VTLSAPVTSRSLRWLVLAALALGAGACQKGDRLLLLDVRASGELPTTVSALRFSAMGWKTRSVAGVLGPGGLLFGYYGPSGSGPVTVAVEAIDARSCVVGTGSATVQDTSSGQTAPATVIYVRPLADTNCALPDAGFDAGAASDAEAGTDAGADADGANDADAGTDARGDASADIVGERHVDAGSNADAGLDAISGGDGGPSTDTGGPTDASDASRG
jgi:hypothetical protein